MTNNLVVIINSLKVQKIKKILLYGMKFLVPNYSCLQNPWLGGYTPRSPFSLFSVLNWICWTPPPEKSSWVRHCIYWETNNADADLGTPEETRRDGCDCLEHCWHWYAGDLRKSRKDTIRFVVLFGSKAPNSNSTWARRMIFNSKARRKPFE